jgi:hypothetical protein
MLGKLAAKAWIEMPASGDRLFSGEEEDYA